ncbi:uncharacterized protein LOC119511383 [Choloepus didactylus]|uniref:uncharacterized protein LOC119511383 n=1 Tax=Choloepus didactylus TaxID=27675 RepID=UPI0018A049F0|nr:uncharacterized protein LOC119511383 [Choloepus didactylus]
MDPLLGSLREFKIRNGFIWGRPGFDLGIYEGDRVEKTCCAWAGRGGPGARPRPRPHTPARHEYLSGLASGSADRALPATPGLGAPTSGCCYGHHHPTNTHRHPCPDSRGSPGPGYSLPPFPQPRELCLRSVEAWAPRWCQGRGRGVAGAAVWAAPVLQARGRGSAPPLGSGPRASGAGRGGGARGGLGSLPSWWSWVSVWKETAASYRSPWTLRPLWVPTLRNPESSEVRILWMEATFLAPSVNRSAHILASALGSKNQRLVVNHRKQGRSSQDEEKEPETEIPTTR